MKDPVIKVTYEIFFQKSLLIYKFYVGGMTQLKKGR